MAAEGCRDHGGQQNFTAVFGGAWGVAGASKGHREPWGISVWQGVAMDSLKLYLDPPCPNLLYPVGGPPLKRPNSCFKGGPPTGRAVCGRLIPLWIPTPYAYAIGAIGNE